MSEIERYCAAFDEWAKLLEKSNDATDEFARAYRIVRGRISKSCLLSRTVYGGEKPSQTPCPVHKGVWSGCHGGWPGSKWSDGKPMKESKMLREWFDAGCRCFMHKGCGCTTGWQPDDACGCGVKR